MLRSRRPAFRRRVWLAEVDMSRGSRPWARAPPRRGSPRPRRPATRRASSRPTTTTATRGRGRSRSTRTTVCSSWPCRRRTRWRSSIQRATLRASSDGSTSAASPTPWPLCSGEARSSRAASTRPCARSRAIARGAGGSRSWPRAPRAARAAWPSLPTGRSPTSRLRRRVASRSSRSRARASCRRCPRGYRRARCASCPRTPRRGVAARSCS